MELLKGLGSEAQTKQSDRLGKLANLSKATLRSRTKLDLNMLERAQLTVTSRLEELSAVQQWFETLVSRAAIENPWVNEQFDQLNLALAEGFTNAVRHAHANLPGSTPIDIELVLQPEKIEIRIFDQGGPFDPNSLSEPLPGSLREGGYGWFLLRRLADQVTYDRAEPLIKPSAVTALPEAEHANKNLRPPQRNCLRIVKTSKIV